MTNVYRPFTYSDISLVRGELAFQPGYRNADARIATRKVMLGDVFVRGRVNIQGDVLN
jgi:hypothetical protein